MCDENFTKISRQNGVKNRKFHANFTLLGRSADIPFKKLGLRNDFPEKWGVAKGSSVSWAANFKGDKNPNCKLSNGWSRSYRGDKTAAFCREMSMSGEPRIRNTKQRDAKSDKIH